MKSFLYFLIFSMICTVMTSQAEIYRWVDENGKVHYSDKPPETKQGYKKLNISEDKRPSSVQEESSKKLHLKKQKLSNKTLKLRPKIVTELRTLFEQRKYKQASKLLEEYERQAEIDLRTEQSVLDAYSSFDIADKNYTKRLNEWIQFNPNNYQAYLARGRHYFSLAWQARGGKFAKKTSKEQFSKMDSYFDLAKHDINKAIEINPRPIFPYCLLIGIAKTHSDSEEIKLIFEGASAIQPASFLLRKHFIDTLLPKWNGSLEEMEEFALNSQKYVSQNPYLRWLKGFRFIDVADVRLRQKNYVEAIQLYSEALKHGDYYHFHFSRGKAYYFQKKYKLAIKDLNQAISLNQEKGKFYYYRSKSFIELDLFDEAFRDIKIASQLEPNSKAIKKWHKWLVSTIKIPGIDKKELQDVQLKLVNINRGIAKNPNASYLLYNRAKLNLELGENEKALVDLKKAIKLKPTEIIYYQLIDYVLFKRNELDIIIKYWEEYIRLKPNDSRAYLERAGTYYHKQNFSMALKDAKKSIDLGNKKAESFYKEIEEELKR